MFPRSEILRRAVIEVPITRQPALGAGQCLEHLLANLFHRALVVPHPHLVHCAAERRVRRVRVAFAEKIVRAFEAGKTAGELMRPRERAVEIQLRPARSAHRRDVAPFT